MKPSIGRIVLVHTPVPPTAPNASNVHAAIVTRVWRGVDTADGTPACVNVKVLPDCCVPFDMTSVLLFDNEDAARASQNNNIAWWPPKV